MLFGLEVENMTFDHTSISFEFNFTAFLAFQCFLIGFVR